MSMFKEAFKPALNKEGFALLTFMGVNKGVRNGNGKEFIKLEFECRGVVRSDNQVMSIIVNDSYEESSPLGIALSKMGYIPPVESTPKEQIEDEDGFLVDAVKEDEDGFEIADVMPLNIEQFFNECQGRKYVAKVSKPVNTDGKPSYWQIEPSSLKPFVKVAVNA